jgi:hypothetical protein
MKKNIKKKKIKVPAA